MLVLQRRIRLSGGGQWMRWCTRQKGRGWRLGVGRCCKARRKVWWRGAVGTGLRGLELELCSYGGESVGSSWGGFARRAWERECLS